jgi:hypothetical protein
MERFGVNSIAVLEGQPLINWRVRNRNFTGGRYGFQTAA